MSLEITTEQTLVILTIIVSIISLHSMYLMSKRTTGLEVFTSMYPVVLVICIIIGVSSINDLKGYPIDGNPPGEFNLITHQQDGDKFVIFIREQDGGFKLYRVAGGEQNKEKMEAVEEKQKEGQVFKMRFTSDNELVEDVVRLDQMFPKEDE